MLSNSTAQDALNTREITHRPATAAGAFYPKNPDTLKAMIEEFLEKSPKGVDFDRVYGLVSPHAGYIFSGWVAAKAYKHVEGREYDAVIIIGPSHYKAFQGASVFNGDAYATPLGDVKLDVELAAEIAKSKEKVSLSLDGHEWDSQRSEHSIEVQLPFIQIVLPEIPIVPVCMGSQDSQTIDDLVQSIVKAVKRQDKKVLIAASTDLSHFHNNKEAKTIDRKFVNSFGRYDYFKLGNDLATKKCEACGGGPVIAAMIAAEQLGANNSEFLQYSTSGESPYADVGKNRVVGYMSGLMVESGRSSFGDFPQFTEEEEKILKDIALNGMKEGMTGKQQHSVEYVPMSLGQDFAAFVTMKKNGELRGCMGHTVASQSLVKEVYESAKMAATRDPRFDKLKKDELDDINFEITILSRFKRVYSPDNIEIGKDGVYLRVGKNSGLFLPQVATENDWDLKTYMQMLSRKAGLSTDAYLEPNAQLYKFRAIIIK